MAENTRMGSAGNLPILLGPSAEIADVLQAPPRGPLKSPRSNASLSGYSSSAQSYDLSTLGHIRRPNVSDMVGRPHTADLPSHPPRSPFSRVQRIKPSLRSSSSSSKRSIAYREANTAKPASSFDRAYSDPTMLPPYIADAISSRSAVERDSIRSVKSFPRASDGAEDPHLVRLTPLGKTYVSYFARPAPFVKYISEKRLSFEEEAELREKAASAEVLKAQLEEMKKLFLEYHKKTEEAKLSKSVSKFKLLLERKGDGDGSDNQTEPDLKTKEDGHRTLTTGHAQNMFESGDGMQSMMQTNVLLRLRLAAVAFQKTGAQKDVVEHHTSSQRKSHESSARTERANEDLEQLHSEISFLDKSTGETALPSALVDAFARGLGDGDSEEADALRAAMAHIKELNMRLSVKGAKAAASSFADRMQRSNDESGEKYHDEIEDDLQSKVHELEGEVESLKKQLGNTTHAGREFAQALRGQPGGSKSIRDYFLSNPPKVVVIPMFFPTAARLSGDKSSVLEADNSKVESESKHNSVIEKVEEEELLDENFDEDEIDKNLGGDALCNDEDFEDPASSPSKFGAIKRSHSSQEDNREMQGWAKWQIYDDYEGTTGAPGTSVRSNIVSSKGQPRAAQSASSASPSGQTDNGRPADKKGSRARHSKAPLDVSPLAKYLKVRVLLLI